jgi:UTP--glucose-1-phosphate uridylyltransferase
LSVIDAVVPVAGRGTRLLPLTRVVPKELLPLDGRPIVQHVVDELRAAGIDRVCLVSRRGKVPVEHHFDDPRLVAVHQDEPRGLGHAVARAEAFCRDRPFLLALGDCVFRTPGAVESLLAAHAADPGAAALVAVQRVDPERVTRYGIVRLEGDRIAGLVEKPAPESAPSDLAVAGRYLLGPQIFESLRKIGPGSTGEIGLTEALAELIGSGGKVRAIELASDNPRYDIGDLLSYSEAFVEFALARDAGLAERVGAAIPR